MLVTFVDLQVLILSNCTSPSQCWCQNFEEFAFVNVAHCEQEEKTVDIIENLTLKRNQN